MLISVRPRLLPSLIALFGALGACGTEPVVVASVEVSPPSATLTALGDTRGLAAVAKDAGGAVIRGKTVAWSSSQPAVATVDAGTGVATAVANGTATITATVDGIAGQATLTVAQAGAQLAFIAPPPDGTAGQALTPAVQAGVRDARGNRVSGASDAVTVSLGVNPGGGTLSGTKTVNAVDGVATFGDLSIERAGTAYSLVASSGALTAASSAGFSIGPGAPAQLGFTSQPANAQAGTAISPAVVVAVQDAFANTVTSASDAVTIAIGANPGGASLFGTTNVVAEAGVARFNDLSIRKATSGYTLVASSGSLGGATSLAFTVSPGPTAELAFTKQPPPSVEGNVVMAPAVEVSSLDAFGNVTPAPDQVTLSLGNNPWAGPGAPGGTLSGTLSAAVANGVASFGNLSVDKPGAGYTVRASLGTFAAVSTPFTVILRFAATAASAFHTCGVTTGGTFCWGDNVGGRLGGPTGPTFSDSVPLLVMGGPSFASVTTGFEHTCGATTTGVAYCWGGNARGELGNGESADSPVPVPVQGSLTFASLVAGFYATCGLTAGGVAYCWGANQSGQLGDGTSIDRAAPVSVSGALSFSTIDMGINYACGVATGGAVYCWGDNPFGQLGDGTQTASNVPVRVTGSGTALVFSSVSAGNAHTCGIAAAGAMYCWGVNGYGQLGNGSTLSSLTPGVVSGGLSFSAVIAGGSHTCGLSSGVAYCWGGNDRGQLGVGTTTDIDVPTQVSGGLLFDRLSAGVAEESTCGRQAGTQVLYCWGRNDFGQLGDGSRAQRLVPTRVVP